MSEQRKSSFAVPVVLCALAAMAVLWLLWPIPSEQAKERSAARLPIPIRHDLGKYDGKVTEVSQFAHPDDAVSLAGRVVTADGKAIGGVELVVDLILTPDADEDFVLWSETTAANLEGKYDMALPRCEGPYRFTARVDGYFPYLDITYFTKEGLNDYTIRLTPPCRISGWLESELGAPISGKVIVARHGISSPDAAETSKSVRLRGALGGQVIVLPSGFAPGLIAYSSPTDENGAFSINDLQAGHCHLEISRDTQPGGSYVIVSSSGEAKMEKSSDVIQTVQLSVGEHLDNVHLKLNSSDFEQTIQGYVTDQAGTPIKHARVYVRSFNRFSEVSSFYTDSGGRFSLIVPDQVLRDMQGGLLPKEPTVQCEADGYVAASVPNVPVGTEDLSITMFKKDATEVAGLILDRKSLKPVENAQVFVWQTYTAWGARLRPDYALEVGATPETQIVKSDADGRFSLPEVISGDVTFEVAHPDYGVSLHRTQIASRETTKAEAKILLDPAGTLSIKVVPTGNIKTAMNVKCSTSIMPSGMLDEKDQERWEFSFGAFSSQQNLQQRDPGVKFRFTQDQLRMSSGQILKEQMDGTWKGDILVTPGEYEVSIMGIVVPRSAAPEDPQSSNNAPPAQQGSSPPPYIQSFHDKQTVAVFSGETKTMLFEIGGDSRILCQVQRRDSTSQSQIVFLLVPGETSTGLAAQKVSGTLELYDVVGDTWADAEMILTKEGISCAFEGVAPGEYSLLSYMYDTDNGELHALGRKQVAVESGYEYEMSYP